MEPKGLLYLIPTPIGNLEDMTLRSLRILKEVEWIAAEDTRHTRHLLNHFEISSQLLRYDEHTKEKNGEMILEKLRSGDSVGLVSDAGMPIISDPGEDIVQKAIAEGIEVVPLPGANAALTALVASGLLAKNFFFEGFLPRTAQKQLERLEELKSIPGTLIFYEAPHRLLKTLKACESILGDSPAVCARELTKKYETFQRGTLSELILFYQDQEAPRGEFVLLIEPKPEVFREAPVKDLDEGKKRLQERLDQGVSKKDAAREIAIAFNLPRREVYQWTLESQK